jgi:hypothetical protein
VRSRLHTVENSKVCWEPAWGSYLVLRERPPLEIHACSPLVLQEWGGGSARGMGEQASTMCQDLIKISNSFKLGDTCGRWSNSDSSCNNLQAVDDLIFCGRQRDREYACQNSTISKMTWLLVLESTNLKQWWESIAGQCRNPALLQNPKTAK